MSLVAVYFNPPIINVTKAGSGVVIFIFYNPSGGGGGRGGGLLWISSDGDDQSKDFFGIFLCGLT